MLSSATTAPRRGDAPATISEEEQQKQTVEAIEEFLSSRDAA